jgi:hypothetical protein
MVEAERYLAEAVRLRGLGEQVAADVRERLRELDRCVADAERLVAEMWTARLRALHHFDQRPARERMTSDRCRECVAGGVMKRSGAHRMAATTALSGHDWTQPAPS